MSNIPTIPAIIVLLLGIFGVLIDSGIKKLRKKAQNR